MSRTEAEMEQVEVLAKHRMGIEETERHPYDHENGNSCDPFFGHEYCRGWAGAVLDALQEEGWTLTRVEGFPR
jgi:hypothetical protein